MGGVKGDDMGKLYSTHGREECILTFVGKPEEKRQIGRPRHISGDNIKLYIREIRWDMDWIHLVQERGY
jgi:hypothetical protein